VTSPSCSFSAMCRNIGFDSPHLVLRLADALRLEKLDDRTMRRAGDVIHFAYGAMWGAILALATKGRDLRPLRDGALLAGGLWTFGFAILMPGLKVQSGPWTWTGREFVLTLSAHAAYGAGTVGALRLGDRDTGAPEGLLSGCSRETVAASTGRIPSTGEVVPVDDTWASFGVR
jgi:hypothetical protein